MTPTSQSFAILMQITVDNLSSFKEMPQGIAGYPLELVFLDVNVLKSVVKEIRWKSRVGLFGLGEQKASGNWSQ